MEAEVSESRLDPSDAQISRHAMGQLAEQAGIMRQCLIEQAFIGGQLERLLEIWWEVTLRQVSQNDLNEFMKAMNTFFEDFKDNPDS
jgi:hypothetical protein